MLKILIDTPRPGDFYLWAARLSNLEKVISTDQVDVVISERSLFMDLTALFPDFLNNHNLKIINNESVVDFKYEYKKNHLTTGQEIIDGYCFNSLYKKIKKQYQSNDNENKNKNDNIYCFITLECEKRKLHSQLDLLKDFRDRVNEKLSRSVTFINNGLTSTIERELINRENNQSSFELEIIEELKSEKCEVINLFGESIHNKLKHIKNCHCAISSLGTASILTYALDVPTLNFGNRYLHRVCEKDGITKEENKHLVIPLRKTTLLEAEDNFSSSNFKNKSQLISYDISKEVYSPYIDSLLQSI